MRKLLGVALGLSLLIPSVRSASRATVFVGARVVDGGTVIEDAVIVVRDGKVAAIGSRSKVAIAADAERIDVAGKTIIAGMINAHGHVGETVGLKSGAELYTEENVKRQLALYARYGITTVVSLGGDQDAAFRLRDAQDKGALDRARIFPSGPVLAPATPQEARKQVAELAARKPDFVKIRVDDNLGTTPKMSPEIYRAVIDEAHRQNLRVAAHLYYLDDAKGLLKAGADFVAHSIRDKEVDQELIGLLKAKDVCVCPTLMREVSTFVYEREPAFFADPFFLRDADKSILDQLRDPKRQEGVRASKSAQQYKLSLEMAKRNLKRLSDAGVRIAMGTDTGPPGRFQGFFEHEELRLMAESGMTPRQILAAATTDAARCMKATGRLGTLQPGAWADLVVLGKNPLDDIANARAIESVWVGGMKIAR